MKNSKAIIVEKFQSLQEIQIHIFRSFKSILPPLHISLL